MKKNVHYHSQISTALVTIAVNFVRNAKSIYIGSVEIVFIVSARFNSRFAREERECGTSPRTGRLHPATAHGESEAPASNDESPDE